MVWEMFSRVNLLPCSFNIEESFVFICYSTCSVNFIFILQIILRYFDMFLKLKDLTSSATFQVLVGFIWLCFPPLHPSTLVPVSLLSIRYFVKLFRKWMWTKMAGLHRKNSRIKWSNLRTILCKFAFLQCFPFPFLFQLYRLPIHSVFQWRNQLSPYVLWYKSRW